MERAVCGYTMPEGRSKVVLEDISFTLREGEVRCILGINGVGKTTLFKSILGAIPLLSGSILIDGRRLEQFSQREIAQKVGYVPQFHMPPFPYTVFQVVVMGRVSHLPLFTAPGAKDREIAQEALATLSITHLADEVYTEISGGERQLVLIARALAQQARFLIMDEPTSNLDLANQTLVLRQIVALAAAGMGVILTTHYPNHAFLCASEVTVLKGKRTFWHGKPEEILSEALLQELYGIDLALVKSRSPAGKEVFSVVSYL